MKYIKKFNEELDNKTYLNAADKLSYEHPGRAEKLRDHVSSKQNISNSEYTLLVINDSGLIDETTAKISKPGDYYTPYGNSQYLLIDSEDRRIYITKNGLVSTPPLLSFYCKDRGDALKLHKDLLEIGFNLPVNKLYTTRDFEKPPLTHSDKWQKETPKKKLPWWKKEM